MESYANRIKEYMQALPENTPVEVGPVYLEQFSDVPEAAYYKAIERFTKSGELVHITKGMYYRPKRSRYGSIPITDDEIAYHYLKDGHGMLIGYRLYSAKGITTQVGKKVDVLSDALNGEVKNAHNVTIKNAGIRLTEQTIPVIETLEILQNYRKIEDADNRRLAAYMAGFAEIYSDETAQYVLNGRKYKKSTIAFLKSFLDHLEVPNTLGRHLSPLSNYAIPSMEEIYETA